jgi:type IV secretion system protein VirD4
MTEVIEEEEEGTSESTVKRQGGILHTPMHEQPGESKVDSKRKSILRT